MSKNKKNRLKKAEINLNTEEGTKSFLENKWFAIGLILLASLVVYHNSLNTAFIFDDIPKIVKNPDIKRLANIKTKLIYPYHKPYRTYERNDPSRPLAYLTFTLNYHFGKLNTFGYHLFNILIHIFNSILVFFLTRKIFFYIYNIYKKDSNLFSLIVALFFAVHPVNTEVVTYVYHRADSLAAFFYLSSLLLFIKTFERRKYFYVFSLLCFILGLFSKQTAVTLPAILLVFDYIFLSNYKVSEVLTKKNYHIPFWLILIVFLLFRKFYLGEIGDMEIDAYKKWSRYSYFIIQPYVILRYLGMLFVPIGLCIDHLIEPVKTIFEFKIIISFISIMVLSIVICKIPRKKTDTSKLILFSALWFFIVLSPTSSFLPILNAMSDRRLYLSGFGFHLSIVSMYFLTFCKGFHCNRSSRWILLTLICIHISLLGMATVKRNQLYRNHGLIWQDVISKYSENFKAHYNLGVFYDNQKEYTKAIEKYQKTLEINPDHVGAHNNLGILYYKRKEYNKATEEFQKTLEINPYYADAHNNLGAVYDIQKEYTKAIEKYQKTLEINPDHVGAHNNLGALYYVQKQYTKAIKKFQKVLEINPDHADAYYNLGLVYYDKKQYTKAIKEFQKVLDTDPDYAKAHYNLGLLYYYQKEYEKALQEFESILESYPHNKSVKARIKTLKEFLNMD